MKHEHLSKDQVIFSFMNNHPLAVISTVDRNRDQPESALVAFSQTDDLQIVFQTQNDTRKFQNLQTNSKVSFVVGWDDVDHQTLQYEGNAEIISQSEKEYYVECFKAKDTPCGDAFLFHPKAVLFKVIPTWIRFSDYRQVKPKIIEHSF